MFVHENQEILVYGNLEGQKTKRKQKCFLFCFGLVWFVLLVLLLFLAFLIFTSSSYHDMFHSGALAYSRFTVLTDIGN